jgi:hypothetical protein
MPCRSCSPSPEPRAFGYDVGMQIRSWIAALCIAIAALPSAAQPPRKFGVLSLIGDSFLIVNHEAAKGTQPASDVRTVLQLPEHAFDNTVAADVREAILQAAPEANAVTLSGAKTLYPREGEPLDDARPVLARVQPAAASAGVTHLVLVTKLHHRADVPIEPKEGEVTLHGLGFYVDPAVPTGNRDAPVAGYLAPFAYFRVWVVDVGRQRIVGYRDIADISPMAPRSNTSTAQLWGSLSSGEKVRMMHSIVREGAQGAVRELVGNLPD